MRYREREGIGKKKMTLWERNGWGNDEMERLQEEWGARCELSEVCLPQVSSGSSQSGTRVRYKAHLAVFQLPKGCLSFTLFWT
jgi:hypothetical protein